MIEIHEKTCRGCRLPVNAVRNWIIENCTGEVRNILTHNATKEVIFDFDVKTEWWKDECFQNIGRMGEEFYERTGLHMTDLNAKLVFQNTSDALMFKLRYGGTA